MPLRPGLAPATLVIVQISLVLKITVAIVADRAIEDLFERWAGKASCRLALLPHSDVVVVM